MNKLYKYMKTKYHFSYNIQGFPTLKFWQNGKDPIDYDGGRESDGCKHFEIYALMLFSMFKSVYRCDLKFFPDDF